MSSTTAACISRPQLSSRSASRRPGAPTAVVRLAPNALPRSQRHSLRPGTAFAVRRPAPSAGDSRRMPASPAVPEAQAAAATSEAAPAASWGAFSEKVGGEWEGYHMNFTGRGQAEELPPHVVPDAFKEWEVKVFDWQVQTSVLCEGEAFKSTLIRLLPTVGCEADASTVYDKIATELTAADLHFADGGSYSRGPPPDALAPGGIGGEVEHCLIDESAEQPKRARIIQRFKSNGSGFYVLSVGAVVEERESDFNGGASLASCGSSKSPLSGQACLDTASLAGPWAGADGAAPGGEGAVGLPGGLWSRVEEDEDAGRLVAEAGWALPGGDMLASERVYDAASGELLSATLRRLSPASA